MPSATLDRVAVVTVSYNSGGQLPAFLDSVAALSTRPGSVVVADNASADVAETRSLTAARGVRLVELGENAGYGAAVNAAVRALPPGVEYVLVSNPDVAMSADALAVLVDALDRQPAAGAVGPRILNPDGTTYPSARNLPSLRTGVGHALLGTPWPTNPWTRAYRAETQSPDRRRSVGWLSGACVLVRRRAFDEVGGFDPGYFMYFEDVDLGLRLGRAGWLNAYEPDAVVTHIGGLSTKKESRRMVLAHHRSAERFLRRKYASPLLAPLRWALVAGLRLRAWVVVRRAG
ncbi:glycosyltransferase family 2 protein [Agromyces aurantiacus]|uniref:Glycosyltransferase family 2 protein n=1 Tax=Agromyces aurantiacus TaxID=165814 RepID=A0ABV9R5P1_9MICO|nr:glycosyltransferase family 2 protein [Agromyces aurantiacus]MBM7504141.1 N-acetylglucosaminyl-diphospho-decaprenol L-rhamnosyltransferase [Agromyces aurantiacus]